MTDDNLMNLLKNYVTKEELLDILESKRTASEQFLEDHDRSFRNMESQMSNTQRQVSEAVVNLNAGLSKLNILSDALSQVMRVMQDNYEAVRTTQRMHEERLGKLESYRASNEEKYDSLRGDIFGDSNHPDQESLAALMRRRSEKADAQHEAMMLRFDNIEARQEEIEKQIEQWRKIYTLVLQNIGNGLKAIFPRIAKWGLGISVAFIAARIGNPGLMNQIGELLKGILGIP